MNSVSSKVFKVSKKYGLPISSQNNWIHFFPNLPDQGFAIVFIDDILLLAQNKLQIIEIIEYLHQLVVLTTFGISPENFVYIVLTVIFLGHEFGYKTRKCKSA